MGLWSCLYPGGAGEELSASLRFHRPDGVRLVRRLFLSRAFCCLPENGCAASGSGRGGGTQRSAALMTGSWRVEGAAVGRADHERAPFLFNDAEMTAAGSPAPCRFEKRQHAQTVWRAASFCGVGGERAGRACACRRCMRKKAAKALGGEGEGTDARFLSLSLFLRIPGMFRARRTEKGRAPEGATL